MSTDIFETAADGTGMDGTGTDGTSTVRAAFDATAAQCRPDIDALTRRALDRGQRVRRHRTVGKAVGSAAAAAAIGLGTAYALSDSGGSARPANVPGSGTHGGGQGPGLPGFAPTVAPSVTSSVTASATASVPPSATPSAANSVAIWPSTHRGTLTLRRAAAWL